MRNGNHKKKTWCKYGMVWNRETRAMELMVAEKPMQVFLYGYHQRLGLEISKTFEIGWLLQPLTTECPTLLLTNRRRRSKYE